MGSVSEARKGRMKGREMKEKRKMGRMIDFRSNERRKEIKVQTVGNSCTLSDTMFWSLSLFEPGVKYTTVLLDWFMWFWWQSHNSSTLSSSISLPLFIFFLSLRFPSFFLPLHFSSFSAEDFSCSGKQKEGAKWFFRCCRNEINKKKQLEKGNKI